MIIGICYTEYVRKTDTYWLAGLLEGEGWFGVSRQPSAKNCRWMYPALAITSTDRDVLEHVKALVGAGSIVGPLPTRKTTHTPTHFYKTAGKRAETIMGEILPLMHERRARRIQEVLEEVARFKRR